MAHISVCESVAFTVQLNASDSRLNNKNGQIFWKSRLGTITDQIVLKNQAPVINDGKLFITTQSPNNNIYAIDIKDGSLIWNYKLDASNNDIPVLFFDNKVFTQSGNNFYSFEANTGKLLSQKTFEEPIHGKAVTDGENVFVANEKNVVFALNPNTLDIVWQFKLDENQSNIKDRIFSKDKKLYFAAEGPEVSSLYPQALSLSSTTYSIISFLKSVFQI